MARATEKLGSLVYSGLAAVGCWCLHPSSRPEDRSKSGWWQRPRPPGTPSCQRCSRLLLNGAAVIPHGPGGAWLWWRAGLAPSTSPNPDQGKKTRSSQGLSEIVAVCTRQPALPQRVSGLSRTGPGRAGWDEAGSFLPFIEQEKGITPQRSTATKVRQRGGSRRIIPGCNCQQGLVLVVSQHLAANTPV